MVTLRNAADTWTREDRPNKVHTHGRRLYVKANSPSQRYAYIYFAIPFPIGATILNAELRLYNGTHMEAGATLFVNRVKTKWARNHLRWDNQPDVFSYTREATKSGSIPVNSEWTIDVTPVMQHVSDGGVWYGFRITCNDGIGEWFHSSEGPERWRPTLEVTWSDAPEPPEDMSPAGGRAVSVPKPVLSFDFTDVSGDTSLDSTWIQIADTKSALESDNPAWDSGWQPASVPEFDLSESTYPGATESQDVWWRVNVRDGAGVESGWSDPVKFQYIPKPDIILNNPPNVAPSVVEDSTPPIDWVLSSGSQTAYQVIVSPYDELGNWLWTTGKISGTTQTVTIPKKIIRRDDKKYNVRVRVWDDVRREKEGDRPIFCHKSRDFIYNADPTTDPVTGLVASPETPYPWMRLEWNRTVGEPDRYEIWRGDTADDMEIIEVVEASDVIQEGTTHYIYKDFQVSGRRKQYWKVVPVVNNKAAKNNPIVSAVSRATSRWLMEDDGSDPIMLLNPEVETERSDNSTVHMPLNGDPILVSQAAGRALAAGQVTGVLADGVVPGLTAYEMFKRYRRLIRHPGKPLVLFNVDENLRGFLTSPTWASIARPDGTTEYRVSFMYYEMGDS